MHLLHSSASPHGRLVTFGERDPDPFLPIHVWLPPGYDSSAKRYPVVYGQDGGQMLRPGGRGSWQLGGRLEALAWQGLETIVVGVGVDPRLRIRAYTPCADPELGGGDGELYLAFLTRWLKPRIDASLRTLPDREHTAMVGASLGGLISAFALASRPEVFGRAAALSPSVHFADGAAWRFVEGLEGGRNRLWVDAGTTEFGRSRGGGPSRASHRYLDGVRRLRRRLEHRGFRPGRDLGYLEEQGGLHGEESWGRRLPGALAFLLG